MAKVTFNTASGETIVVEDAAGTLMEVATSHDVEGIMGSCGGVCSCVTCHVHVRPEWRETVGPASELEQDLLDMEDNVAEGSRLSCQIEINGDMDGLVVDVPNE
jgi:2Fe-2S ferredoxin